MIDKQLLYEEKAKREKFLSMRKQIKSEIADLIALTKEKRKTLEIVKEQLYQCNKKIVTLKIQRKLK